MLRHPHSQVPSSGEEVPMKWARTERSRPSVSVKTNAEPAASMRQPSPRTISARCDWCSWETNAPASASAARSTSDIAEDATARASGSAPATRLDRKALRADDVEQAHPLGRLVALRGQHQQGLG